ncbi:beta-defensin 115 [Molossus molossus]|uniref:beta-defensin 115 n=1 Tax=Molossus molossus TaxID=27622 RepID=UPI00174636CC|nr:beta-defensin 115 [Molossus molossus]
MLLDHSSPLSGYIKLLFLALAVLLVLDQASPAGWVQMCNYGTGQCRPTCKENERKKGNCVGRRVCCLRFLSKRSASLPEKQEMTCKTMASATNYLLQMRDKNFNRPYNESVK